MKCFTMNIKIQLSITNVWNLSYEPYDLLFKLDLSISLNNSNNRKNLIPIENPICGNADQTTNF